MSGLDPVTSELSRQETPRIEILRESNLLPPRWIPDNHLPDTVSKLFLPHLLPAFATLLVTCGYKCNRRQRKIKTFCPGRKPGIFWLSFLVVFSSLSGRDSAAPPQDFGSQRPYMLTCGRNAYNAWPAVRMRQFEEQQL
jgi:hypothetical protein